MGLEAVELDGEALGGPAEVGRDLAVGLVDEGPRQFVGIEEGEEAAFEPAWGVGCDDAVFLDEPFEAGRARALRVAIDEVAERRGAREPERLGSFGGAREPVLDKDRSRGAVTSILALPLSRMPTA